MTESNAERSLATLIEWDNLPRPEREVAFLEGRKYRADFLWPAQRLIVEVEGGSWTAGRHTRGAGFESDCEKQALAVLAGYRYIRVTPRQIDDGRGLWWIRKALELAVAA